MFPLVSSENPLLPEVYKTVDAWLTAVSAFLNKNYGHVIESVVNLHRGSENRLSIEDLEARTLWVVMERGSNEGHYVSIVVIPPNLNGGEKKPIQTLLSVKTFAGRRFAAIVQHDLSLAIGQ